MEKKEIVYSFLCDKEYRPMKYNDIAAILGVPEEEKPILGECLDSLVYEELVFKDDNGKYICLKNSDYKIGIFENSGKGFGFLRCADKSSDVYIAPKDVNTALNKDKVVVKITKENVNINPEGYVYKILERNNSYVVGRVHINKKTVFVIPDDEKLGSDIFIKTTGGFKLKNDMKAVVKIRRWPKQGKNAEGVITEVLGFAGENEADVMSVIRANNIRYGFNNSVIKEAENVSAEKLKAENRVDFRSKTVFTVDSESSKDLDDAIGIERCENGYILYVHIADVTHYVKENSLLDNEAYLRGTSVYFADRVVPMLPKELSNGICSLNENEERYTLSVIMKVDKKGKVTESEIVRGIIKSKHKMTYTNISKMLNKDKEITERYKDIYEDVLVMNELSEILTKARDKRGYINFNFPEAELIFDENKNVVDIKKREITKANLIIEEFMLLCNETVAEFAFYNELPFIYRVHEKPSTEKLENFKSVLGLLGYSMKGKKEIHPAMFNEILKEIKDKPEEKVLNTIMLRSMMKAKYLSENLGHFGLALSNYCHFTSPIRRYPDLVIHRILKEYLDGKMNEKRISHYEKFVKDAAEKSSDAEIVATDAERTIEDMKKAEYMEKFIGCEMEGVISSITSFGIFVEFENTVEGLVRYAFIKGDYFKFDEKTMSAVGERTNKTYKIGDVVTTIVENADRLTGKIDLSFA